MNGYVGAIVFVIATLFLMFWLMRGRILKEKFTLWWIVLALGVLVFTLFPGILPWASAVLGIETPSNFVFFVASLMFLLVSVQYSVELSRADDKTRKLAEEVAILRTQLEWLADPLGDQPHRRPTALRPGEAAAGGEAGTTSARSEAELPDTDT